MGLIDQMQELLDMYDVQVGGLPEVIRMDPDTFDRYLKELGREYGVIVPLFNGVPIKIDRAMNQDSIRCFGGNPAIPNVNPLQTPSDLDRMYEELARKIGQEDPPKKDTE